MERRSFLKTSGALSAAAVITGCDSSSSDVNAGIPTPPPVSEEKINWSSCTCNCGHVCPTKVITRDGIVTRIETDDVNEDVLGMHQARACARGRSTRQKIYAPDRLKVPMKRVGPRGEVSSFVPITWDEALDTIAEKLKSTYDNYGPSAVYPHYGTGRLYAPYAGGHWVSAGQWGAKILNLMGGYLSHYGTYSSSQQAVAGMYTWGGGAPSSHYSEIKNSDLIITFGFNPAETRMSGTGGTYDWNLFTKGKEVYAIDPRHSDSMAYNNIHWVPIRPGTDAALIEALAYHIISTDRHDKAFLDKYSIGFDADTLPASAPQGSDYKSHILGLGEDKTPKTPEWAEKITGYPAEQIVALAEKLVAAKAPFICCGLGPQRHAIGEQTSRAIFMLPLIVGAAGRPGTNTGGWPGHPYGSIGFSPTGANPYKGSISFFTWADATVRGTEFTQTADGLRGVEKLDSNIRFIWNHAGNALINQHSDSFGTHEILASQSEDDLFILVQDVQMTPSAKYADILLPDLMDLEYVDVATNPGTPLETVIAVTTSCKPMFETKSHYDFCWELAKRLGLEAEFTEGKASYQEWVEHLYSLDRARSNGKLPEYSELVEKGILKISKAEFPTVGGAAFFSDPDANPIRTPSGKIEIYSERLAEMAKTWTLPEGDFIPAIPMYHKTWESVEDEELKQTYPLQLIGHHTKGRTHSSFHNIPWLREAVEDAVWINPIDANERGIVEGAMVTITSPRGSVKVRAKVTPRIMPGVTSLPQGAWFDADINLKQDIGGNVNSLTKYHPTPIGKCNPQHTNLVEIQLA